MPQWGIEPHERASIAGWRASFCPLSGPSITKFGAFVRIMPGIDGLVHISEISNERVNKVSDVLKVGDEVRVKLTAVDFDRKRISLSMKACLDEAEDAE